MTDTVAPRPATVADAELIAGVAVRAWHHAYAGIADPRTIAERDLTSQTALWQARLADPKTETYVVEVGARIVGYVTTGPGGDPDTGVGTGGVLALYVDPSAQGVGRGRLLLADAEDRLRAEGYRDASLWVFAEYGLVRRFYERQGWVLDPSGDGQEDDSWRELAVRYRRDL